MLSLYDMMTAEMTDPVFFAVLHLYAFPVLFLFLLRKLVQTNSRLTHR